MSYVWYESYKAVVLETDSGGLTVRAQTEQAALEYRGPGVFSPAARTSAV